jgi:hypothetical protein
MTTTTVQPYPVKITGQLDKHLSRWLWLLKWVLVIPHVLVLIALWAGFLVLTAVAFVAILFTRRYPRAIFDYNVGVLRWTWRVSYYAYGALGTDVYPPFTLADRPDYPARMQVDYPEQLSRGLALVKWWLLALPHYVIVGIFVGGGAGVFGDGDVARPGGSLVGLLVLIAGVVLLVTGAYPRPIFDFVLGMNRWALRVIGYAAFMTDKYPPFRLDQGGSDAGVLTLPPGHLAPAEDATPEVRAVEPRRGRTSWTGGRITALALGAVSCLLGLALAAAGTGLLIADQVARDETGMIVTDTTRLRTSTAALVESDVGLPVEGPSWFYGPEQLGTLAISVTSSGEGPLFVGLAPRDDVLRWLSSTAYDELDAFGGNGHAVNATRQGAVLDPADARFWVAQSTGTGEQQLTWEAREGDWAVVAMNADGSPGLTVQANAGATFPHLKGVAVTVLVSGVLLLGVGALAIALAVPAGSAEPGWRPERRP